MNIRHHRAMKTDDLTGEDLDLWTIRAIKANGTPKLVELLKRCARAKVAVQPSNVAAQAEYVITHAGLECRQIGEQWWAYASMLGGTVEASGPTFEIAAMRAFVKATIGDAVPPAGP
jgi:hypothetical protein